MPASVKSIQDCLGLVFSSFANRRIPTGTLAKQIRHDGTARHKGPRQLNESQLLPFVRLGLICFFRGKKLIGESETRAEWKNSGKGKLDFHIDGVALELAVRSREAKKELLGPKTNQSEVKKLLTCDEKRAVLALFDFSDAPWSKQELNAFRPHPTLPQGVTPNKPYTLLYFHIDKQSQDGWGCFKKEIRRVPTNPA